MSRRGDNIRKRKDGRWEGRYQKYRNLNGSIIYGSVYGKSYSETKEKLHNITSHVKSIPQNTCSCTFGDVLRLWISSNKIRLKGGTINKYQNIVDMHLMPELGSINMRDINSSTINNFLSKKLSNGRLDGKGPLSPSYVRSITIVINSALKYAISEGFCEPLRTPVNKPSLEKKDIPILNKEEQKKLEFILNLNLTEINFGILLCLYTGLRIGELCALSWNDIDLVNKIIHIRHTVARVRNNDENIKQKTKLIIDKPKTKASIRDIPIPTNIYNLLLHLKQNNNSIFVISSNSSFINPRTFEYHYHQLLQQNNIPHINFHAIRHTFATRCIEAGIDIKSLSEILGHSNVSITLNTYVHSSIEQKRIQLEKLTIMLAS